jgi:hypothetical protein
MKDELLLLHFFHGRRVASGLGSYYYRGFIITNTHARARGRTPMDEWSARRIDLYLRTHNSHKRQTSMLSAGFETTILARERPQTHALDCAVTTIGLRRIIIHDTYFFPWRKSLLIVEDSRSHWGTPHLVRLLLVSDRPDTETYIWREGEWGSIVQWICYSSVNRF